MQPRQHKTASFLSADPVFWSAPNLSSAACKAKSALNCACSSGTFEDDDHVAGDSKRHEAAEVLFHQRQCETYPLRSRQPKSTPDPRRQRSDRAPRARRRLSPVEVFGLTLQRLASALKLS